MTDIYLEIGTKRIFAGAVDWPGWSRSGKTEEEARAALGAAAARYAVVAEEAGIRFSQTAEFEVVERVTGSATTDFGAPGAIPLLDHRVLTADEGRRQAALVEAAWTILDRVSAAAPLALRKGPRSGGRDRDQVVEHVRLAEESYAGKIGIGRAAYALRPDIRRRLETVSDGGLLREKGWPSRYAARRIAWHVLDHAWEIEDNS